MCVLLIVGLSWELPPYVLTSAGVLVRPWLSFWVVSYCLMHRYVFCWLSDWVVSCRLMHWCVFVDWRIELWVTASCIDVCLLTDGLSCELLPHALICVLLIVGLSWELPPYVLTSAGVLVRPWLSFWVVSNCLMHWCVFCWLSDWVVSYRLIYWRLPGY
jgi:hypothetical protein